MTTNVTAFPVVIKQIAEYDAAASVAETDRLLIQPGAAGTPYKRVTVADLLTRAVFAALASGTSYDDDAAAASGGVAVGQIYRNGNFVMIRLT